VVEYDVENHGHAAFMAFVDEAAVGVGGSVGFVGCEIEIGVVAPALVAAELHDGEELHGVDSEGLEIVELGDGLFDGAVAAGSILRAGEVADEQLVDYEVGAGGTLEISDFPCVVVLLAVEHGQGNGGRCHQARRIGGHVGEYGGGDGLVVLIVEHEVGVGVAYLNLTVDKVVVGLVLAVGHAGDCAPEVAVAVVVGIVHLLRGGDGVVVPRAAEHDRFFVGSHEAECGGAIGVGRYAQLRRAAGICFLLGLGEILREERQVDVAAYEGLSLGLSA